MYMSLSFLAEFPDLYSGIVGPNSLVFVPRAPPGNGVFVNADFPPNRHGFRVPKKAARARGPKLNTTRKIEAPARLVQRQPTGVTPRRGKPDPERRSRQKRRIRQELPTVWEHFFTHRPRILGHVGIGGVGYGRMVPIRYEAGLVITVMSKGGTALLRHLASPSMPMRGVLTHETRPWLWESDLEG